MPHPKTMKIDEVEYIRKDSIQQQEKLNADGYVIIRSNGSGVHMGFLVDFDKENCIAELKNSRRIYYWSGAATLSELAVNGTKKPSKCQFPVALEKFTVTNVLEIIPVTQKAKESIDGVPIWEA